MIVELYLSLMKFRLRILAGLLMVATFGLPAQETAAPEFHVRQKVREISPEDIIRDFSAPPVEDYLLSAGDEIFVEVWGHAELSGKHIVGPDGRITLPVSGPLKISDLSREAAQQAINSALGKFYADVSTTVRVDRYASWHVYVLGRVGVPGALQFDSQPNLLEVLTRAGSLPVGGVGADKAGLVRCAVFRGNDRIVWIDLKQLVAHGNLALNIRLARNDLVYLPDADDQLIYVLGEVKHPGALRLTPDMSLLDAFSLAGGETEDGQKRLALIRPSTGKQIEITLKEALSPKQNVNYSLEEGDIIFVPQRGLAKFGYILQKTSPLTGFAIVSRSF